MKSQQTSNWENPRLSPGQIAYAATDAWICQEMYTRLDLSSKKAARMKKKAAKGGRRAADLEPFPKPTTRTW